MSKVRWKPKDVNRLAKKGLTTSVVIPKSTKGSKYRNRIAHRDGRKFHSEKEAKRYDDLRLLEKAKEIVDLKCQQTFSLDIDGVHVCNYIADFTYTEVKQQAFVVEDVKSDVTRKINEYQIKKNLMKAIHKITILET